MQDRRSIKRIPPSRQTNSPRLQAPAGYVVVVEDVDLGDRFKIVTMQELNSRSLARETDLAFATELFLAFSAGDAAALARELHGRFAPGGDIGDWFDLDRAQIAQLREVGRPAAPSLRDLALSAVDGQSLVEKSQVISAAPESRPRHVRSPRPPQARAARPRPRRRWPSWLLLIAIIALGASVVANAPQLRRLLSGGTDARELPARRKVIASATAMPSPTPTRRVTTLATFSQFGAAAGDVLYALVRANARTCASRECRVARGIDVGERIVALGYSHGEVINGDATWIKFRRDRQDLYMHISVLSRDRRDVSAISRPSATFTRTAAPSPTATATPRPSATATATPTVTAKATNTIAPSATSTLTFTPEPSATATVEPSATVEPTSNATPIDTAAPTATATLVSTATATELPTVLYIDTANNLNANLRACPSTDCDILGRLRPGAEVRPAAEVEGEVINGIAAWIAIEYEGGIAYVHGELVAEGP